jgi:hypothetical protein
MKYTTEEIKKRMHSIEYVLGLGPDKISMTAQFRKETESRLAEFKDELARRVKSQDFAAQSQVDHQQEY